MRRIVISASDFHFLTTLKNQATIAISKPLLYENMEEQVRQRTKELVDVQKQLIQVEKLATVGTLAGGVAHEINNPLTTILTNAQMLLSSNTIDELDRESLDAIKQIERGGSIHIKFYKNDDWINIDVKDEGAGMSKETVPKIFDPFFTTKDVGKGVGLGLSICQAIVEKHNGTITFKSEVNKGATFTVQLPIYPIPKFGAR